MPTQQIAELTEYMPDGTDDTLLTLSRQSPLLFVFLRHFGCTFCREALTEIRAQLSEIEASGARVVFVHMSSPERARELAKEYDVEQCLWVSDPRRKLYRAFELRRGTLWQLFGPAVWLRGFVAGVLRGHGVGKLEGDGFQMPGAFLVQAGTIVRAFRHASAGDTPDYCELASATTQ